MTETRAVEGRRVDEQRPLLTDRRIQILLLAANGHGNREIAALLGCSVETIKVTFGIIQRRLGATDRTHAVAIGLKRRIIRAADITLPALNPPLVRGPIPRPKAPPEGTTT